MLSCRLVVVDHEVVHICCNPVVLLLPQILMMMLYLKCPLVGQKQDMPMQFCIKNLSLGLNTTSIPGSCFSHWLSTSKPFWFGFNDIVVCWLMFWKDINLNKKACIQYSQVITKYISSVFLTFKTIDVLVCHDCNCSSFDKGQKAIFLYLKINVYSFMKISSTF